MNQEARDAGLKDINNFQWEKQPRRTVLSYVARRCHVTDGHGDGVLSTVTCSTTKLTATTTNDED